MLVKFLNFEYDSKKPYSLAIVGFFCLQKNILKKFDLSVDSINFKVYNKDIELGTA